MLPIQFAIEIETAIINQVAKLDAPADIAAVITLIEQSHKASLELLTVANTVNIDITAYPEVNESQLLGSDTVWQLTLPKGLTNANLQVLITLWQLSTEIDKTAQFYQQAATNSAHPQSRLFFNSLSHVKRILLRRLNSIIQIYCNYYWGELGFAPFLLGKD